LTPRKSELLNGNAHTLPVDFHSWRRAYCQSLADAGVNQDNGNSAEALLRFRAVGL